MTFLQNIIGLIFRGLGLALKYISLIITSPVWLPFWLIAYLVEHIGFVRNALIATDLYLPFKNMERTPLRFALTVFAIFIAFLIYGALTAFDNAMNAGVDLAADDRLVTVNKINFTQTLPIAYAQKVTAVEGVDSLVHMNWFGGYYKDPREQVITFAVDQTKLLEVYGDDMLLDETHHKNWLRNQQGLLVGELVAKKYGWKVGDRIPLNSNIFSKMDGASVWDFVIEGVYSGKFKQADTNGVYFHYKYFNEALAFGSNQIGWLGIKTTDPSINEKVIKAIDDMFVNSPFETETVPEKAFNKSFIAQMGDIGLIVTSSVSAAFFIILVIVGFSMALAIRERTNEIGVMKTLGFTSRRIFKMVLMESMMLACLGGTVGLAASSFAIKQVTSSPQFPLAGLMLNGEIIMQAIILMVFLGLITGIVPAINALRLNIITALSRR